mgnify:CR=1 FL=1
MKYLVMVSHGRLADGLHNALGMLAGSGRDDIRSTGLEDGMSTEVYEQNVRAMLADVGGEDEVLLLGDLIGGSPLTKAIQVVSEMGLLSRTVIIGGMNLPVALNAALMKDETEFYSLAQSVLENAEVQQFVVEQNDEEDDI